VTAHEFGQYWVAAYPAAPPLPHLLRQRYPGRWLRVRSLPGAKRYAATAADWAILLARQQHVLADVLGNWAEALLVTGSYADAGEAAALFSPTEESVFKTLSFTALPSVGLHEYPDPHEPDNALVYWPSFARPAPTAAWLTQLLQASARDECRAFFFQPQRGAVVAPYDDGLDGLLPDQAARDYYRRRYLAWLSDRPDGL